MPVLDGCINALFEPGNIGSSVGTPPVIVHKISLYPPIDYNPDGVSYSLDYKEQYNSGYLLLLLF